MIVATTRSPGARPALLAFICLALVVGSACPAAAVNHPFGSHPFAYAPGTILPSHVSQAARDQAVRDFYDEWKVDYVKQACGPGRYLVESRIAPGNLTVSEAHGYGMILMALMAGYDPNAQTIFDGMFEYFDDHRSAITPSLMAWYQDTSCEDQEGDDSASDGDLDIAYALLLADKQWGSCGAIDYLAEAKKVIAGVKSGDLDTTKQYVKLGDWVSPSEPEYAATRSSDFMPDHYRSFGDATGSATWTAVLDRTYQIVSSLQQEYSPTTGLLPDFVLDPLGMPEPAQPDFHESENDGAYDYNACRDPLRLGTDFVVTGETRAKTAVQAINAWIRETTDGDPENIRAGYQLDGTPSPDSDELSMAFVAPLGVGAMVDASNQVWLNAIWDLVVGTSIDDGKYFENTLKLLSMIVMSGNWWPPEAVTGGCAAGGPRLCGPSRTLEGGQIAIATVGRRLLATSQTTRCR
jgi:endo-1,4-beta-D-glucanase Y